MGILTSSLCTLISSCTLHCPVTLGPPLLTPLCLSGMHIDFPTGWILSNTTKFFSVWGLVEFFLLSGLYELGLPASWVVLTVEWYFVLRLLLHFFLLSVWSWQQKGMMVPSPLQPSVRCLGVDGDATCPLK